MLKAVPRQTLAITADQMAMSGSESQATGEQADHAQQRVEEAVARLVEHELPDDAGGDARHDPGAEDDDPDQRHARQLAQHAAVQRQRDQEAERELQHDARHDRRGR